MITNVTIEKVKGIGYKSFDLEIKENKYNLLVAPNGFGKSSFLAAFDSLRATKMELKDTNVPIGGDNVSCKLSITDNGDTLTADNTSNKINSRYKICCINCRLTPKAIGRNFGGHVAATGYLGIQEIELSSIPPKAVFGYKYSNMQKYLLQYKKLLNNIEDFFATPAFTHLLDDCYTDLDKLLTKGRQLLIKDVFTKINTLKGTIQHVADLFNDGWLDDIKKQNCYNAVQNYLERMYPHFTNMSELDKFLSIFQIIKLYNEDKTKFKKAVAWADYEVLKMELNAHVAMINTTGRNIVCKEDQNHLILSFPKPHTISNGQRDVMILGVMLKILTVHLTPTKKHILIIDEVFDYLDDANILAAQYYLSVMVNKAIKNGIIIYPIIMTHLSPERFINYAFPQKKLNVQYLKQITCVPNENVKRMLMKRNDSTIKNDVSCYLLHYSKGEINKRAEFRSLGLKETWGEGTNFLQFIIQEINKYLSGNADYDPYSVCTCVRIRIEKIVCDQLHDNVQKDTFESTHKTVEKLKYAESCGVSVNDIFYLLGILYNDVEHTWSNGIDKPAIYKLENLVVRKIISDIFDFKGDSIKIDSIH